MQQTLLLNASYEPLKIVNWQKAITLLCQGKVEVIREYDREIHAVSFSVRLPCFRHSPALVYPRRPTWNDSRVYRGVFSKQRGRKLIRSAATARLSGQSLWLPRSRPCCGAGRWGRSECG